MLIEIDFNSEEAIYIQLRNQIILGIATSIFQEGDSLPSVRQLADTIGVNMHTVNKAWIRDGARSSAWISTRSRHWKRCGSSFGLYWQRAAVKISLGKRYTAWWTTYSTHIQE